MLSFVADTTVVKTTIYNVLKFSARNMKPMRKLRTLDEVTEQYFRDHPEEIDDYLTEILQEFSEDNDIELLLASLIFLRKNVMHFSELA